MRTNTRSLLYRWTKEVWHERAGEAGAERTRSTLLSSDRKLYAYVGNDPLNNTDPLGLWLVQIGLGATGKGFWSVSGEWGVAVGTGGIGVYTTGSTGAFSGVGEEGAFQAALTFTPSGSVSKLTGAAVNASISGGELGTVGVNYGVAANGASSYGISAGIGGGTDFQASETVQATVGVCLLFCGEPSTTQQQPQQQLTPEMPVSINPAVEFAQPNSENDVNGVNFGNTNYFPVPQLSSASSSQTSSPPPK